MKKKYISLIIVVLSLFLISTISASLCPTNYVECKMGTSILCTPTSGYCYNLQNNAAKSCSLEKGSTGIPKACCSSQGSIIDYRLDGSSYHCCSADYPYYHSSDGRCYNKPQSDSDNYYTRLSSCTSDKCDGKNYYKCTDSATKWIFKYENMGKVLDKCGVDCLSNSDCSPYMFNGISCRDLNCKCDNNNYYCIETTQTFYRLSNNVCTAISSTMSKITDTDYDSLVECQAQITNTYYRLENNICTEMVLSVSDKTENDYATKTECESKITQIFYRLEYSSCSAIGILSSGKTVNDYNTLEECQAQIPTSYYRLENNTCTKITIPISQKTVNDFEVQSDCQNKITSPPNIITRIIQKITGSPESSTTSTSSSESIKAKNQTLKVLLIFGISFIFLAGLITTIIFIKRRPKN